MLLLGTEEREKKESAMREEYSYRVLNEIFESACDTIAGYREMDSERFNKKVNADTWSTAEVLRHITKFNTIYMRKLEKAIYDQSHKTTARESFSPGFIVRQLLKTLEPPYKVKIKTISPMDPGNERYDVEETVNELLKTEEKILELIEFTRKEQCDLDKIKTNHPIFKILKMSATEFLAMTDAHQRRHFWQIEQNLEKL